MKTEGACFCGAIQYTAELDENRIGICHCRDCQIISGSAFRTTALVDPRHFEITRGEPRSFAKTAASGRVRALLFCGDCGTHLCSMPPDAEAEGAFVSLRASTSKDFHRMKPAAEIWCASKVDWMPEIEGSAKFDGQF